MKKIFLLFLLFAALFIYGGGSLLAASSDTYTVSITVVETSTVAVRILESNNTVTFSGYIIKGSSVISSVSQRIVARNTGGVNNTYKLKITGSPSGWTPGTASLDDIGADRYVLASVFHQWDVKPGWSDYQDNDVIKSTEVTASSAAGAGYFVDDTPDGADDASDDGFNVPPSGEVSSFFFFRAPSSLSAKTQYGSQQTVTVTLTAAEQN